MNIPCQSAGEVANDATMIYPIMDSKLIYPSFLHSALATVANLHWELQTDSIKSRNQDEDKVKHEIKYRMDIVDPDLSQPDNTIGSFKISGLLESAICVTNAPYDDPDILDRLRVKTNSHHSGDKGWDVFSLE